MRLLRGLPARVQLRALLDALAVLPANATASVAFIASAFRPSPGCDESASGAPCLTSQLAEWMQQFTAGTVVAGGAWTDSVVIQHAQVEDAEGKPRSRARRERSDRRRAEHRPDRSRHAGHWRRAIQGAGSGRMAELGAGPHLEREPV